MFYQRVFRAFAPRVSPTASRRTAVVSVAGCVGSGFLAYLFISSTPNISVAFAENRASQDRKKLVVLGSGFAAVNLLRSLDGDYDVSVVSPRNYFLFSPLLTSVAVGTNDDRTVIQPVRHFCSGKPNDCFHFYEAKATAVDVANNKVICQHVSTLPSEKTTFELEYDKLVVAVGSKCNTFGVPDVEKYALFLKSLHDAQRLRHRIMDALELASIPGQTDAEQRRLLTFLIVGGGPTGTELAAEMHDLLDSDIKRWFPSLHGKVSIVMVQSADHILNTFDKRISIYAEEKFKRDNIQVLTDTRVKSITNNSVVLLDKKAGLERTLPYGVCVWSTGIEPKAIATHIANQIEAQNHSKALRIDKHCKVIGSNNIYAIGDCSVLESPKMTARLKDIFSAFDSDKDGALSFKEMENLLDAIKDEYPQMEVYHHRVKRLFEEFDADHDDKISLKEFEILVKKADAALKPLPSTAQVAEQMGEYLGHALNKLAKDPNGKISGFKYRHFGSLAKLGTHRAAADLPAIQQAWYGFVAWYMWIGVFLGQQYFFRSRFMLIRDWITTAIFGRDMSRF